MSRIIVIGLIIVNLILWGLSYFQNRYSDYNSLIGLFVMLIFVLFIIDEFKKRDWKWKKKK